MTAPGHADYVRELVDQAPPLTAEQQIRLRGLLSDAPPATTATRSRRARSTPVVNAGQRAAA